MKIVRLAAVACLLIAPKSFAVEFCNYSNWPASCAVAGCTGSDFQYCVSEGWWGIGVGSCVTIASFTNGEPRAYYCRDTQGGEWGSDVYSHCVKNIGSGGHFVVYDSDTSSTCSSVGGTMKGFAKIHGLTVNLRP